MLWLTVSFSLADKFIYHLGKRKGLERQEVVEYIRKTPVEKLAKDVQVLFKLDDYKESIHYAEIIKGGIKDLSGKSYGNNDYSPMVTYVGCGTLVQNWQWGNDATIPAGCTGTDKCWGTNLGSSYATNMDDTLYSPIINTSGYDRVVLVFNHYYYTESGFDYGQVLCSPDGGTTWNVVSGTYSGGPVGWVAETLDISICGNSPNTRVAFAFHSDGSIVYDGWYIDDVTILGSNVLSSRVLYASSFEGVDDGDLVPTTIVGPAPWERGNPSSGPGSALFGSSVWATNLAGDYNTNADEALQKQNPISLTGFSAYILRFYHWYDTETSYDSGWVEISVDGGATWTKVSPAYKGHDSTWYVEQIDLTPYSGSNILFRFRFQSDYSITYSGWYIDSVSIRGENYSSPTLLANYNFDLNDGGFTATSTLSTPDPYGITNNYLEWWLDILTTSDFGTYTARTGASHTYPNITLLYGAQFDPPSAWSSWTTIHSLNTNTDYISKNSSATPPPGFTQAYLKDYASQVICEPSIPRVTFIYDIINGADSLMVKEIFWITGTDVNSSRLWHKTIVINNSSSCAQVGVRWEYDTHVDATDHPAHYQCDYFPAFTLSCGPEIPNPIQVGPPIPDTFDLFRESDANPPSGSKYHLFAVYYDRASISVPDFVYHARWPNAHGNTWTYTLATSDDITVETGLDNAFVYFWEPTTCLSPGDSIVYSSFFGSLDAPLGGDDELGVKENYRVVKGGFLSNAEGLKIYDITGKKIYEGKGGYIRLKRGIYFVYERGKVIKVLVR